MALANTNLSLMQVVSHFASFAERNMFIKQFGYGDVMEINTQEQEYTLLWIDVLPAVFSADSIAYNFRVWVLDIMNEDRSNELDIISDAMKIHWDLIQTLDTTYDYITVQIGSSQPIKDEFDDRLAGSVMDVSVIVPTTFGACDVPLNCE